jgi:MFS family permease
LLKRPTFAAASLSNFFLSCALFGAMILLPLYWQNIRHMSTIETGLMIAPQGIGAAIVMPISGRLTDRMGGGLLSLFGVSLLTITTIPFALVGAHTSLVYLSFVNVLRGVGLGFGFMPAWSVAMASLKREELGHATPQLNVIQRSGGSIGTAVLTVVLYRALIGKHTLTAMAHAYGLAFWASAILCVLAVIPCLVLLRTEKRARAAQALAERGIEGAAAAAAEVEAEAAIV